MASTAKPVPVHKLPFDEAKFATMVEPFTVRVEKIKGNARTPIPMPESDDPNLPAGTGWTKDLIRGLESWLVTEWAGGGLYNITIVDSSAQPISMSWSPFWDPRDYPEKMPPPLAAAQQAQQAQQAAQPSAPSQPTVNVVPFPQHQVRPMSAFPQGLPSAGMGAFTQPQQYAQPYGYMQPHYQLPPPPPVGTMGYQQWKNDAEDRRREDEIRLLREREAQREREMLDAKHKAELERVARENETRFQRQESQLADLRSMIGDLAKSITAAAQPKGNDEVAALKAQIEEQRRQAEAERRERETRDMIRQAAEQHQRQIEMMAKQIEAQAQAARDAAIAATNNRPDPMIAIMQEQSRQNADAIKELSRGMSSSIERLQSFMLTPAAMMDFASRQSQATDSVTDKLSRTFGNVMDLQQRVIENAISMQPQGSGAVDVIRDGLQGVKEMVERYTGMRTAEQRIAADAQVRMAQAQAHAIAVQAAAMNGSGLGGPTVHVPPPPVEQSQIPAANGNAQAKAPLVERFGRTDEEWFGPALPEVLKLRAGVAHFIESLEAQPPRMKDGEVDGISPTKAAENAVQAIQFLVQRNIAIGAMTDLVFADRFKDFVDVLIPDAPATFREDTTEALTDLVKRLNGMDPDDPQDQDPDDPDDDEDGKVEVIAPSAKGPRRKAVPAPTA